MTDARGIAAPMTSARATSGSTGLPSCAGGVAYADVDPRVSDVFETLAFLRARLAPAELHRVMGRYERTLHPVLAPFCYQGSRVRPEATVADFDLAYSRYRAALRSASAGPSLGAPAVVAPRVTQMWAAAAGDPVAAAWIVMSWLVSEVIAKRAGYELDPERAAMAGHLVGAGVEAAGAAGITNITRSPTTREPSGRGAKSRGRRAQPLGGVPARAREPHDAGHRAHVLALAEARRVGFRLKRVTPTQKDVKASKAYFAVLCSPEGTPATAGTALHDALKMARRHADATSDWVGELKTTSGLVTARAMKGAMLQGERYARELGLKGVVVRFYEMSTGNIYDIVRR